MERRQPTLIVILLSTLLLFAAAGIYAGETDPSSSDLPVNWKELTAPDFIKAVEKSGGVCLIPIGVFEKHGPHLPLGTDLFDVREITLRAAKKEYALVFPEYYFSQILEAKHQPGAIAYSPRLIWDILQETCDEISRNGIKKIILVSGHGGNNNFLPFFGMAQLEKQRDYCVVLFEPETSTEVAEKVKKLKESKNDGHAGENGTSTMQISRPDLVHKIRSKQNSNKTIDNAQRYKAKAGSDCGVTLAGHISSKSGRWELNPRSRLGRPMHYHYATPACYSLLIISRQ